MIANIARNGKVLKFGKGQAVRAQMSWVICHVHEGVIVVRGGINRAVVVVAVAVITASKHVERWRYGGQSLMARCLTG